MIAWAGFRADADFESGTGHFTRCLALARAWKSRGGEADFLSATMVPALTERLNDAEIGHYPIQSSYPSDDDLGVTPAELESGNGKGSASSRKMDDDLLKKMRRDDHQE